MNPLALKGRHSVAEAKNNFAPSGLGLVMRRYSQGVALGFTICAFQARPHLVALAPSAFARPLAVFQQRLDWRHAVHDTLNNYK